MMTEEKLVLVPSMAASSPAAVEVTGGAPSEPRDIEAPRPSSGEQDNG